MKILSIETSCDDTGITIMEVSGGITNASFKVLADSANSQIATHIPYGGVYPALAKREHQKNLPILLEQVLLEAKLNKKKQPVDIIAVTYGPGLEMCLWEGITFAKDLAKKWNVPLIPTDHMEGHICSVFGKKHDANEPQKKTKAKFQIPKIKTPLLSLLVSGGHTQLIVSKKWMEYEIIGETLDDAVGEAYDKVARMLGLPYPGGPEISRLAEEARAEREKATLMFPGSLSVPAGTALPLDSSVCETPRKNCFPFSLPRPMLKSKDFNFSYSGLKTSVLYLIRDMGGLEKINEETKRAIALEFETAAIECLIYKTAKAIEKYNIKTVIVGGGVSCNEHLRNEIKKLVGKDIKLYMPPKNLSGDNSLMIGIAGYLEYTKNKNLPAGRQGKFFDYETIKADGNVKL